MPKQGGYHRFFQHYHLEFDGSAGRAEFRKNINRIFRRNGVAFTLTEGGSIERTISETLSNELRLANFRTGDAELDELLESARQKFLAPSEDDHRDALEKLGDAWERLKTVDVVEDKNWAAKRCLMKRLAQIDNSSGTCWNRKRALTGAGNSLRIRHSETKQERLGTSDQMDYMFRRMFALINLILKTTGQVG